MFLSYSSVPSHIPTLGGVAGPSGAVDGQGGLGVVEQGDRGLAAQGGGHSSEKWALRMF